ncbi:hypothetical protein [Seonamhaeicola maritimus]|uniref:hypothetical protein n=1 Tax=Seonamhaeicola maritimus TaxID=2591822 RepID=UPI0024946B45|nr:hypothetical protein [Seonamhaeicola maritimus]
MFLLVSVLLASCSKKQERVNVFIESEFPQTEYAINNASELFDTDALQRVDSKEEADIIVSVDNGLSNIKEEGFVLSYDNVKLGIKGKDAIGAMYGVFEVAEQLSFGKSLSEILEKTVNPSMKNRFIKFNLPWSSYRENDVISLHEETCRDTVYWKSFLDMMAKNRLNALSLWNLHPFADMIKVEKYPEASPLSDSELLERKKFYKKLFAMAKERGVQTYIVNWNIFVSKEFAEAHKLPEYNKTGGHYGDGHSSELIEDYMRECVRQVINEYPNLTGIGLTLGERMGGMVSYQRRDWADRTIIEGMRLANRKAKLLYRAPLSASTSALGDTDKRTEVLTREYLDTLKTPKETVISFKYNWSHGHSSDKLFIVHGGKLTDTYWNPAPTNYSVLWTVRNEDFFVHRWAQPDFVRDFGKNNLSQSYNTGCIIGSECYIPAKDYFSNEAGQKHFKYAFERQWLWYSIWGRMLYDMQTEDNLFAQQLNRKFGIDYGTELLETWKTASDYYHRFASFYKGSWDGALYSEAFTSMMRGPNFNKNKIDIITMQALGNRPVLDTTKYVNISDYVKNKNGVPEGITTPVELADILNKNADKILTDLEHYRKNSPTTALEIELTDLETLAYLQKFFAKRIDATLLLAEHLLLDKELAEAKIKAHLDVSIKHWEKIIELKERFNKGYIPYVFKTNPDLRQHLKTLKEERDNFQNVEEFWYHRISTLAL